MPGVATSLSPACRLRHRDGLTEYPAVLDFFGRLYLDFGPLGASRTLLVEHPESWLLVHGSDADLAALRAAGAAVGDGRPKGDNS